MEITATVITTMALVMQTREHLRHPARPDATTAAVLRLQRAFEEFQTETGRMPSEEELTERLPADDPVHDSPGFVAVVLCRFSEPPEQRAMRARTRLRVKLALWFLPPSQRDRYRQEWTNEMVTLPPREAASFALMLLLSSPATGLALILKKVLGRKSA